MARSPASQGNTTVTSIVYFEEYSRIEQAIAREKEIKGWVRIKKDALIAATNADWKDLAADWYRDLSS